MDTGICVPAPPTISMVSCARAAPSGSSASRKHAPSRRTKRIIAESAKEPRRSFLMRADRRREAECLRDALADAAGLVTLRIRPDVDAIQPARLADLRFDLRRRQLVLRMHHEIQGVAVARERAQ